MVISATDINVYVMHHTDLIIEQKGGDIGAMCYVTNHRWK